MMRELYRSEGLLLVEETEEDLRRGRLLGVMRELRPNVVHELSSVCIMIPLA